MKILVTGKIYGNFLEKLRSGNEIIEGSLKDISGVDAVLSMLTDKITKEVLDQAGPQLKIIANYAVGFDNIDLEEATKRGITVTNTPCEEVDQAVAEHTMALIFALARRIVESDEVTKKGAYYGWQPDIFVGTSLKGKTLGVLGMGKIGKFVAKMGKAIGMKVIYCKRTPEPEIEKELAITFCDINNLLAQSDVVTLHTPLTPETKHMINHESLGFLKTGALIVNTARGAVIDEEALVDALRSGKVGGAALDVFDHEPQINPELIGMENVILTPHIASATKEARNKMSELAVNAILEVSVGRVPQNKVN